MKIDWTHKSIKITDIRKVRKFYVLTIDDKKIVGPLFVDHNIFEGRVNSYYLRGFSGNIATPDISRSEVVEVKWNMVINKGFYIKFNAAGEAEEIQKESDKYYISFLEIEGPLGMHISN